ncbi:MAG: hypothetical protein V3V01_09685 [Acidimicrobiales bacterium]
MSDPTIDDETLISIELFNQYLKETEAETRAVKAVAKAERAKKDAATAVSKLSNDASAEEKAVVESKYRESVEFLAAVKADPLGATNKARSAKADEAKVPQDEASSEETTAGTTDDYAEDAAESADSADEPSGEQE